MAKDSMNSNEDDLVEVLNESELDDLVQVLGVVHSDYEDEVLVQNVEIDDGDSVFIDMDEVVGFHEMEPENITDSADGNDGYMLEDGGLTNE